MWVSLDNHADESSRRIHMTETTDQLHLTAECFPGVSAAPVESSQNLDGKTFGGIVKQLRKRAGLTQTELAARLGYRTAEAVSLVESDRRTIDPEKLPRLAGTLGVAPRALTILGLRLQFPQA